MVRTLKQYARTLARLVLAVPAPRATLETEDGEVRSLGKAATETVRRLVGHKRQGVFSPLDGEAAQALLNAVESSGFAGDIFEVRLPGRAILFLVTDAGLEYLAWPCR